MLTEWITFAVTMLLLFGGLGFTIWEFRREETQPARAKARESEASTRRDAE